MPPKKAKEAQRVLVEAAALPPVFARVLHAKRLLAGGQCGSAAEAARLAGISRSAFYKYRDAVFSYEDEKSKRLLTVHMQLKDTPGVLSKVLGVFAASRANVLTVNQNIPLAGSAAVSVSVQLNNNSRPSEKLLANLNKLDGVQRIDHVFGEEP